MKRAVLILIVSCFAVITARTADAADRCVYDEASVLSDAELATMNERAMVISEHYAFGVAVVVTPEMDSDDAYKYAENIFNEYGVGYGSDNSGLLLFLSLEDRDYAMIAYGFGNVAFTDHGKDVMLDKHILPLLKNDKYYEAISVYLDLTSEYLAMAKDGTPFDKDTDPEAIAARKQAVFFTKLAVVLIIPIGLALIVCLIWLGQMKTAKTAKLAHQYIPDQGFNLTASEDRFLYRTERRVKIDKSSSSSSGGGTTVRSSGSSGRSGKF